MKQFITFSLILISLTFISCDSDYSGDIQDTFKMYYAVEADTSSSYSLEFYVNDGIISVDTLESSYASEFIEVTKSDSFYMKLNNFEDDALRMIISKGYDPFRDSTITGTGEFIIQGRFDQE